VARRGGTLLMDWDLRCEHRIGLSGCDVSGDALKDVGAMA
jgi:hypothetical protein